MNDRALAIRTLSIEVLVLALMGTLAVVYFRSQEPKSSNVPGAAAGTQPEQAKPDRIADIQTFAAEYPKKGRSISDLSGSLSLGPGVDLIVFIIDTSASMNDDRQELRDSIKKVLTRNKGKLFNVVNYADIPVSTGDPTRDVAELQARIESATDLGGSENSFLALSEAAAQTRQKYKKPVFILMTDAAPNDGRFLSNSRVTIDQAADAVNSANGELHIWAGFDQAEFASAGAAATSDLYPQLISKIKAGGNIYYVKHQGFDPSWVR
ncbi:MAG TPA: vWA domain-containing protein [Blastocatellia bacterium]|nr:vWA domain-containing protein [Blastocatellia bacterium]